MARDDSDTATRLKRLEDERGIIETLHQYAHGIDYGDEKLLLDCFTETGAWSTTPMNSMSGVAATDGVRFHGRSTTGPDSLRALFGKQLVPPMRYRKHLMVDPLVTIEGDSARVRSYFFMIEGHPDGPFLSSMGTYVDSLVRCLDGKWRFEERSAERENLIRRSHADGIQSSSGPTTERT